MKNLKVMSAFFNKHAPFSDGFLFLWLVGPVILATSKDVSSFLMALFMLVLLGFGLVIGVGLTVFLEFLKDPKNKVAADKMGEMFAEELKKRPVSRTIVSLVIRGGDALGIPDETQGSDGATK